MATEQSRSPSPKANKSSRGNMAIILCLAFGLVVLMMPQRLNDYTDYTETGNVFSIEPQLRKQSTGPIVSEYEHAIESISDEDSDSSDEEEAATAGSFVVGASAGTGNEDEGDGDGNSTDDAGNDGDNTDGNER
eukprot:scaffold22967_cov201-Cylindrotheca_fusiformis.AAC.3